MAKGEGILSAGNRVNRAWRCETEGIAETSNTKGRVEGRRRVARVRGAWVLCESLLGSLKQGREVALFAV